MECTLARFQQLCKKDEDARGQEKGIFSFEKSRESGKALESRKLCRCDRRFQEGRMHNCWLCCCEIECVF